MGDPDQDDGVPSERRVGSRLFACFPAYLQRDDGTSRASMIRDLSATGALLLVRADLKVGDVVQLKLFIQGDVTQSRDVGARVVRVEKLEDPFSGPWSLRIAVHFDSELADVLPEIQRLADHQAAVERGHG